MLYRKRQVVSQKLITAIHAQANVIRLQVQELIRLLQLPSYDATKMILPLQNSAAAMAKWFRRQCNIQETIIANLTQLLESNDIVTSNFDFGTPRVDSRSIFLEEKRPMIITNSTLTGCRQRFSLAYELGLLLIMNGGLAVSNKEASHQANLFAAELLMPEEEIRADFEHGITVDLLAQLKPKWKVSMIALLYRADDLGYLTPNQKRYLLQQFNALNIRRREPLELDIAIEQPQLIKHWVAQVKSKLKLSTVELAALLCMELTEFMERYN
jgi:Zn-dependent peptidase ImmA (M78 family)